MRTLLLGSPFQQSVWVLSFFFLHRDFYSKNRNSHSILPVLFLKAKNYEENKNSIVHRLSSSNRFCFQCKWIRSIAKITHKNTIWNKNWNRFLQTMKKMKQFLRRNAMKLNWMLYGKLQRLLKRTDLLRLMWTCER